MRNNIQARKDNFVALDYFKLTEENNKKKFIVIKKNVYNAFQNFSVIFSKHKYSEESTKKMPQVSHLQANSL